MPLNRLTQLLRREAKLTAEQRAQQAAEEEKREKEKRISEMAKKKMSELKAIEAARKQLNAARKQQLNQANKPKYPKSAIRQDLLAAEGLLGTTWSTQQTLPRTTGKVDYDDPSTGTSSDANSASDDPDLEPKPESEFWQSLRALAHNFNKKHGGFDFLLACADIQGKVKGNKHVPHVSSLAHDIYERALFPKPDHSNYGGSDNVRSGEIASLIIDAEFRLARQLEMVDADGKTMVDDKGRSMAVYAFQPLLLVWAIFIEIGIAFPKGHEVHRILAHTLCFLQQNYQEKYPVSQTTLADPSAAPGAWSTLPDLDFAIKMYDGYTSR